MSERETRAQRDCSFGSLAGTVGSSSEAVRNGDRVVSVGVLLVQLHGLKSCCHAFFRRSLSIFGPTTRNETGVNPGQPDVAVDALRCCGYRVQKQLSCSAVALRLCGTEVVARQGRFPRRPRGPAEPPQRTSRHRPHSGTPRAHCLPPCWLSGPGARL